jgi:DNA repair protein RadC
MDPPFKINEHNSTYTTTRPVKADEMIRAAHELIAARFTPGTVLSSPAESQEYLVSQLSGLEHEAFACLFMDNRHRILEFRRLVRGTIDGCSVHPREVVKISLLLNSAAVIFSYNHPSGVS